MNEIRTDQTTAPEKQPGVNEKALWQLKKKISAQAQQQQQTRKPVSR
jgi:hypothetical protein